MFEKFKCNKCFCGCSIKDLSLYGRKDEDWGNFLQQENICKCPIARTSVTVCFRMLTDTVEVRTWNS